MTALFRFCQHVNVRMRYLERERREDGDSDKVKESAGNNATLNVDA